MLVSRRRLLSDGLGDDPLQRKDPDLEDVEVLNHLVVLADPSEEVETLLFDLKVVSLKVIRYFNLLEMFGGLDALHSLSEFHVFFDSGIYLVQVAQLQLALKNRDPCMKRNPRKELILLIDAIFLVKNTRQAVDLDFVLPPFKRD